MITFVIKDKSRKMSSVDLVIAFSGAKYKRSIGVSVPVSSWNGDKKRLRTSVKQPNNDLLNDIITKWELTALRAVAFYKEYINPPSKEELFAFLDKDFYHDEAVEEEQKTTLFVEYMQTYINRYSSVRSLITVKKYYTAMHKLQEYEKLRKKHLRFEDFDINFYNDFQAWFYSLGYSDNYFGTIIKIIKQMHREARFADKLHTNENILHKDFVVVNKGSGNIYLSEGELLRMHELDITPELVAESYPDLNAQRIKQKVKSLILARDRFLIGAYTGLRISDFGRLSEANIDDKYIRIKTIKTGSDTVIPIHPIIRQIIASGFDASITISDQKLNNRVKELAMLSGIDEEVTITKHIGGKMVEVVENKYKLVSSHTARRSFATNAYKSGVPTLAIMKITGHTKESTFLKYIKVSAEENAELLSRHPFFSIG